MLEDVFIPPPFGIAHVDPFVFFLCLVRAFFQYPRTGPRLLLGIRDSPLCFRGWSLSPLVSPVYSPRSLSFYMVTVHCFPLSNAFRKPPCSWRFPSSFTTRPADPAPRSFTLRSVPVGMGFYAASVFRFLPFSEMPPFFGLASPPDTRQPLFCGSFFLFLLAKPLCPPRTTPFGPSFLFLWFPPFSPSHFFCPNDRMLYVWNIFPLLPFFTLLGLLPLCVRPFSLLVFPPFVCLPSRNSALFELLPVYREDRSFTLFYFSQENRAFYENPLYLSLPSIRHVRLWNCVPLLVPSSNPF